MAPLATLARAAAAGYASERSGVGRRATRAHASCRALAAPRAVRSRRRVRVCASGADSGGAGGAGGAPGGFLSGVKATLAMLQSKLDPIPQGATLLEAVATGLDLWNVQEDRSVALNVFEETYKRCERLEEEEGVSDETTAAAVQCLWGKCCCYASFGDLEMAKQNLRDALIRGLDFETAVDGAGGTCAKLKCAAQLRLNLQARQAGARAQQATPRGAPRALAAPACILPAPLTHFSGGHLLNFQRFAKGDDVSFGTFQKREFNAGRRRKL